MSTRRMLCLAAGAAFAMIWGAGAASAGSYYYNNDYGNSYYHAYGSNYHCKQVIVGYRKIKVYSSGYGGYGYGYYGGHYRYVREPIYKNVCSYGGY